MNLAGPRQQRLVAAQMRLIRRLERISRPRLGFLMRGRAAGSVHGLIVLAGTTAAFLAPPFTGLDTLPALGIVVLSIGFLLEDALIALGGLVILAAGVSVEILLGKAALDGIRSLF
jgi:hypothetical protein